MGPNDAELVRVYSRGVNGAIADVTFPVTSGFEIAVDAEAGSAIHGTGAEFLTNVFVRDLTANTNIPVTPSPAGLANPDSMGTSLWPNLPNTFVYKVKAADLAGKQNHVCQAIATLIVGKNNPDASFAMSPLFMLTK